MPRHPRVHAEGLLYHVIARGNDGQKIFLGESDYQAFIEALRTVRQRYPFSLYAYVLMPNHFHLLLEVHRFPTARILQSLLTGYARRFNKIHRRRGHLFEGRYKAIVCDRDNYLLELVRYIHLNPVRASTEEPGVRSLPLLFGHTLDQSANRRVVQFQVTCDFHLTVAVLVYRL